MEKDDRISWKKSEIKKPCFLRAGSVLWKAVLGKFIKEEEVKEMEANSSLLTREPIPLDGKSVGWDLLKFARRLRDLELSPFTKESVEAYKKEKLVETEKNFRPDSPVGELWSKGNLVIFVLMSVLLFFGAGADIWGGVLGLNVALFGLFLVDRVTVAGENEENVLSWERLPLSRYDGPVPEKVKKEIARIKEVAPLLEFEVEYLVRTKDRKVFDPFLIVKRGESEYYVEVWDEESFGGVID